jgi:hypothetical protein
MILTDLRTLPYAKGAPVGGKAGEGCEDIWRHVRRWDTYHQLWRIQNLQVRKSTSGPWVHRFTTTIIIDISKPFGSALVLKYGDLRLDNIMVELAENKYIISGILDWQYSGFYLDYYESVRCTNFTIPYEEDHWYLYLPDCVSPSIYVQWWLFDRVRESRVIWKVTRDLPNESPI